MRRRAHTSVKPVRCLLRSRQPLGLKLSTGSDSGDRLQQVVESKLAHLKEYRLLL